MNESILDLMDEEVKNNPSILRQSIRSLELDHAVAQEHSRRWEELYEKMKAENTRLKDQLIVAVEALEDVKTQLDDKCHCRLWIEDKIDHALSTLSQSSQARKDELIQQGRNQAQLFSVYEARAQTVEAVFSALCDAIDNPCSFRSLIYDKLGFTTDAYERFYKAGGMRVTNFIFEAQERALKDLCEDGRFDIGTQ